MDLNELIKKQKQMLEEKKREAEKFDKQFEKIIKDTIPPERLGNDDEDDEDSDEEEDI